MREAGPTVEVRGGGVYNVANGTTVLTTGEVRSVRCRQRNDGLDEPTSLMTVNSC
jgi:hypothetical protein